MAIIKYRSLYYNPGLVIFPLKFVFLSTTIAELGLQHMSLGEEVSGLEWAISTLINETK